MLRLQQRPVSIAGVLAALIRMVQQACRRLSPSQRHVQGLYNQPYLHVFIHRPAHDFPCEHIFQARQIQKTFFGHVSREVALQEIGCHWILVTGLGGDGAAFASVTATNTMQPNQPLDPLVVADQSFLALRRMDTRTTVGLATVGMNPAYLLHQRRIRFTSLLVEEMSLGSPPHDKTESVRYRLMEQRWGKILDSSLADRQRLTKEIAMEH